MEDLGPETVNAFSAIMIMQNIERSVSMNEKELGRLTCNRFGSLTSGYRSNLCSSSL